MRRPAGLSAVPLSALHRRAAAAGTAKHVNVLTGVAGEHAGNEIAVLRERGVADGTYARVAIVGWMTVGAAEHVDQGVAGAFAFARRGASGRVAAEDNRVNALPGFQQRSTDGTGLHDAKRAA